mgnify:CR=1 FL=1|tara:strand:+ start:1387 stop:1956 length:570 start_codon:yes stop_codon:yes gene_type:complete
MDKLLGSRLINGSTTYLVEAKTGDFLFIDSLRKKEGSALGFIPKAVYESIIEKKRIANRDRWKYSKILITIDNGEKTGFCYITYAKQDIHIQQIVIQKDARRWQRAKMMLDYVECFCNKIGKTAITARVAIDLESNIFWKGCGYNIETTTTSTWLNQKESKSKRPLHYYIKYINSIFLTVKKTPTNEMF